MNRDFDIRHSVKQGCHLYQFYKGDEDYFNAMTSYFQAGLEQGDACLWIVSAKNGLEEMKRRALERIPNFSFYLEERQMEMRSAEDWYLKDGRFDAEQALAFAGAFMEHVTAKGFKRVRACGDLGTIPREDLGQVQIYEAQIHKFIKKSAVIALCAYPILDCPLQTTRMILEEHDDVLIGHL